MMNQRTQIIQHGVKVTLDRKVGLSSFNKHLVWPRERGVLGEFVGLHIC